MSVRHTLKDVILKLLSASKLFTGLVGGGGRQSSPSLKKVSPRKSNKSGAVRFYGNRFYACLDSCYQLRAMCEIGQLDSFDSKAYCLSAKEEEIICLYRELLIFDRFDVYDVAFHACRAILSKLVENPSLRLPGFVLRHVVKSFCKNSAKLGSEGEALLLLGNVSTALKSLPGKDHYTANMLEDSDPLSAIQLFSRSVDLQQTQHKNLVIRYINLLQTHDDYNKARDILDTIEAEDLFAGSSQEFLLSFVNDYLCRDDHSSAYMAFNAFLASYDLVSTSNANDKFILEKFAFPTKLRDTIDGPLVTVIMPLYNDEATVEFSLSSILNQTYRNIEILIFDDCSTDGTREVISSIKSSYSGTKDIRIFTNKANTGPYVSRNVGIKLARGQFITFQDGDDFSHPQRVAHCVNFMANHPASEVINCMSLRIESTGKIQIQRWTNFCYLHFAGATLFFKAEVFGKLGLYDCVRYDADFEFSRRIDKILGPDKVQPTRFPLYFALYSGKSLTSSGRASLGGSRASKPRLEYKKSFLEAYRLSGADILVNGFDKLTIGNYEGNDLYLSPEVIKSVIHDHLRRNLTGKYENS